ncbi:hypothetical protein B0H19DRAFT_1148469 [Mycena capillaripes]|nr:hypothetical protein B0H19DRAFT_1148469 [Mycena capillaripes]
MHVLFWFFLQGKWLYVSALGCPSLYDPSALFKNGLLTLIMILLGVVTVRMFLLLISQRHSSLFYSGYDIHRLLSAPERSPPRENISLATGD